ncbi:MAG: adenylate/guanylate cyclase domain-containing protein [Geovibrio sp.]|nr:adenylate/guanylate cyclase domain-containing protein [Geovibrio sp.]
MKFITSFFRNYKFGLLAGFLIFSALLFAFQPRFIDKFALGIEDGKFHFRSAVGMTPKPYEDMVIVTVDEYSVNKLGRWPWRRDVIGDLFYNLRHAGVVTLDIVFSEHTEPERDSYLAEKISEADNIILGFFMRDNATQETTDDTLDALEDCAYLSFKMLDNTTAVKEFPYAEVNIDEIAHMGMTCAYFNTEADADGLYRRYPITYIHKGYLFSPLGIQALRYFMNQDVELVIDKNGVKKFALGNIVFNEQSYFKLNYYDDVKYISAYDVYSGKVAPEFFENKIVVVGVTETGVYDMRPTPISPITPGVSLHYTAISNLLEGHLIKWRSTWDYMLIFPVLLIISALSFIKKQYLRWLLYIAALGSVFAVSYGVFIYFNIWLREFYALFPSVLMIVGTEAVAFFKTELHAIEVKKAFGSYVSPELVEEILSNPDGLELSGQERDLTILFSDIRGFTTLSESLTPTALVSMLNRLLDPMTNVILRNRGMLDKYIGDAMMAVFNTPVDVPDHPDKAVKSALELLETLKEVNAEFAKEGIPVVDIGIGVNTGTVVVGNMGSKVRFEYTAIGDSVNLASRLEGLCKQYKNRIVISEFTRNRLTLPVICRVLDRVRVKGKHKPVEIFEPMTDTPENRVLKDSFEKALDKYFNMNFNEALALFLDLAEKFSDGPSEVFAERCADFLEEPPAKDWDGVYTLKSK